MEKDYRKIAVITDAHGLLEPTKAALDDIKRRGITEIYSLGDNIGVGPNPSEVMDLLEEHGVISIAGNAEEYVRLGIEPFSSYFGELHKKSHLWTLSKLNEQQIGTISLYPSSIELLLGGKKISLCHFANDVRCDFDEHSTWSYQNMIDAGMPGYKQFLYTNSDEQLMQMKRIVEKYGKDSPMMKGYLSSLSNPLFSGHKVNFFDAVIQGHVHWKVYEPGSPTSFYSIRSVGMAYKKDPIDTATYVILSEKSNGFDLEEVLVQFDREKMEYSILKSDSPDYRIYQFTGLNRHM